MKIKVGIFGYGNLGHGVESELKKQRDMELCALFTRRDPSKITTKTENLPVCSAEDLEKMKVLDVVILCGGSAKDLPNLTPRLAEIASVVDSFDTHSEIPKHFSAVDAAAKRGGKTALISCGWDPGLFSLCRLYASAILPNGKIHTFWGRGVSQGHSEAIRKIKGVKDARQYTIPNDNAIDNARQGGEPLPPCKTHTRECYIVAEIGADLARIEREIKQMPHYFDEYETTVHFVSPDEFAKEHTHLPHGGRVICAGKTGEGEENSQLAELSLILDSNPEFTASVLVAYARAIVRLNREGQIGCKTVFDIPPSYLSPRFHENMIAELL